MKATVSRKSTVVRGDGFTVTVEEHATQAAPAVVPKTNKRLDPEAWRVYNNAFEQSCEESRVRFLLLAGWRPRSATSVRGRPPSLVRRLAKELGIDLLDISLEESARQEKDYLRARMAARKAVAKLKKERQEGDR